MKSSRREVDDLLIDYPRGLRRKSSREGGGIYTFSSKPARTKSSSGIPHFWLPHVQANRAMAEHSGIRHLALQNFYRIGNSEVRPAQRLCYLRMGVAIKVGECQSRKLQNTALIARLLSEGVVPCGTSNSQLPSVHGAWVSLHGESSTNHERELNNGWSSTPKQACEAARKGQQAISNSNLKPFIVEDQANLRVNRGSVV
jgi:hypothetical protein